MPYDLYHPLPRYVWMVDTLTLSQTHTHTLFVSIQKTHTNIDLGYTVRMGASCGNETHFPFQ